MARTRQADLREAFERAIRAGGCSKTESEPGAGTAIELGLQVA